MLFSFTPHVDRLLILLSVLVSLQSFTNGCGMLITFVDWCFLPQFQIHHWKLNAIFSLKEMKLCLVQMNGNFGKYRRAALHHACQSLKFRVLFFGSCLSASPTNLMYWRAKKMLLIILQDFCVCFNSGFFIAMILILSMPVYYIGITIESNYFFYFFRLKFMFGTVYTWVQG